MGGNLQTTLVFNGVKQLVRVLLEKHRTIFFITPIQKQHLSSRRLYRFNGANHPSFLGLPGNKTLLGRVTNILKHVF